jgi:outer membrane protein assembly factor BamD
MLQRLALSLALSALLFMVACGGSSKVEQSGSVEERFKRAKAALDDGDYDKAKQIFEVIVIQDPASEYADDAQFYLGETYFQQKDYKLAAFNFNRLRSSFPNSPFYKQALFEAAESYYQSAPTYNRDQRDTKVAIDQFKIFADFYPADSLANVARARIKELRGRLAQKDLATADQYVKLDEYKAALIYYERVIELYPDTDFYAPAVLGRIRVLGELDRKPEALAAARAYLSDHANDQNAPQVQQLIQELSH